MGGPASFAWTKGTTMHVLQLYGEAQSFLHIPSPPHWGVRFAGWVWDGFGMGLGWVWDG
jgi:hypothetical protein